MPCTAPRIGPLARRGSWSRRHPTHTAGPPRECGTAIQSWSTQFAVQHPDHFGASLPPPGSHRPQPAKRVRRCPRTTSTRLPHSGIVGARLAERWRYAGCIGTCTRRCVVEVPTDWPLADVSGRSAKGSQFFAQRHRQSGVHPFTRYQGSCHWRPLFLGERSSLVIGSRDVSAQDPVIRPMSSSDGSGKSGGFARSQSSTPNGWRDA